MHFTGWPDWETPVGDSLNTFKHVIETAVEFI